MQIMKKLMYSCKDICELTSQALDEKLPLPKKIKWSMHLAMCQRCSCHRRQLLTLRRDILHFQKNLASLSLTEEKKEKIKKCLRQNSGE